MGIRGVWSLENVEIKKPQDDWVSIPSVWTIPGAADNAYVGGGSPNDSKFDKITFATDGIARVPSADLNHGGGYEAGVFSSAKAGYFAAGKQGTPTSNSFDRRSYVRKLTYATETISNLSNPINHSPSGSGQGPRGGGGAMSATDGYVMGGSGQAGGDERSWVSKLSFSSETWSAPPNLPTATQDQGDALGNLDAGYLAGGTPGNRTLVQKITYASDTTSRSPSSDLPNPSRTCAAAGNATAGFIMARQGPGYWDAHSSIFKLTYANGTASLLPSNLGIALRTTSGTGNLTKGYVSGGYQSSGHDWSGVQKLTYETGTGSRSGSLALGTARQVLAVSARDHGASGIGQLERWFDNGSIPLNTAYATAGVNGPSPVYKTDLSTMTAFAYKSSATQSPQRTRQGTFSSSSNAYMNGGSGSVPQSGMVSNTDKLVYSTDTTSRLPGSNSPVKLFGGNGIADANYGWFWGGHTYGIPEPYNQTNLYKVTFSTDAMSTSPAQMTAGNYYMSSTNSATAGYTFSGQTYSTNTQKMTFSTESCSMLPAQVPSAIYNHASAIGNQTAGYVNAGHPAYSAIVKTVWATETSSKVADITSPGRSKTLCFGNTTLGFWGGGTPGPAATVDQITYATDTVANVPGWEPSAIGGPSDFGWGEGARSRGIPVLSPPPATPTASTVSKFPATLPNFGYQQGHSSYPTGDEVRKIDFATEVGSEIPGRLPQGRRDHCSFTSTLASYIAGGSTSTAPANSQIDKTVYATGTSSNVVNGSSDSLEPGRYRCGAAGNQTNGWTMGGNPARSRIDKFYYSSETNQGDGYWNNDGPGPNGRYWQSTLSAPEYIYVAGGGDRSNFWRFTYGIGSQQELPATFERTPGAPTTYGAEAQIAGLGNLTQGYVGGGKNPGGTGGSNPYMQKIVYSTETVTSLGGILTGSRYGVSNCGDLETGYFLGGAYAGPTGTGKTTKLTYSSETYSVCPGADTASQKRQGHGSGAKSFGIHCASIPVVV